MQDHYSITEFSLGTYVRILPLHNEHAGVQQRQQCTVVNGEKALSDSLSLLARLWRNTQT